ncbi:MAG: MarR family winged helix-turn-helix transcriptional regulator [Eggerthellaceae bacterium]|nr:MarR family winged helix-turn-helix transcriptional regulator [Eggerthellaceae bacterium]
MSDISIIERKMRLMAQASLGKYGIGFPEQLLIMYLNAHKESNQTAIAEALEIDKGSITKTLSKLEAKGLVSRAENPANRREKNVVLTPAAGEILDAMHESYRKLNDILLGGLTDEQIAITCESLSIIANNLVEATQDIRP